MVLRNKGILESIKKKSKNGYFETLIRTVFLENREQTVIQFEPEKGKGRKEAETLQAHLAQKKGIPFSAKESKVSSMVLRNKGSF